MWYLCSPGKEGCENWLWYFQNARNQRSFGGKTTSVSPIRQIAWRWGKENYIKKATKLKILILPLFTALLHSGNKEKSWTLKAADKWPVDWKQVLLPLLWDYHRHGRCEHWSKVDTVATNGEDEAEEEGTFWAFIIKRWRLVNHDINRHLPLCMTDGSWWIGCLSMIQLMQQLPLSPCLKLKLQLQGRDAIKESYEQRTMSRWHPLCYNLEI